MARKKDLELYGPMINDHLPSIRKMAILFLQEKLFEIKRTKESVYKEGAVFVPEDDRLRHLPLKYIAVIQDGTVKEMIRVNEETAEILLSNNIELHSFDPKETIVRKNMLFKNGEYYFGDNNEEN